MSARGSTSPSGNALTEFIWNFGDGSSDVVLSHPHAPRYSYPYGGNYTITLVVKDDWGRYSNPDTILVTVNHHPVPVAYPQKLTSWPIGQAFYRIPDGQVVYPRSRIEPQGIIPVMSYTYWKIDSSSSSDRDGWIISQHLNWAGNHIGSGQVFYIAIPADGSMYTIELTVIDNEGLGNSMRYGLVSPLG
ncbi:PKD domain-containing protein [Patescibacteria group bacterium]|nr:PKD domain-containing protein [Patescibacteria group bacterium]MBU4023314.1 PKD domain-containing protein [Patescibacteria group bacterium]